MCIHANRFISSNNSPGFKHDSCRVRWHYLPSSPVLRSIQNLFQSTIIIPVYLYIGIVFRSPYKESSVSKVLAGQIFANRHIEEFSKFGRVCRYICFHTLYSNGALVRRKPVLPPPGCLSIIYLYRHNKYWMSPLV